MSMAFGVPNCFAGADISPCRFVGVSTAADNTLLQITSSAAQVIGVTDDTTRRHDSALICILGDNVPLQDGRTFTVEAGAAITRGSKIMSSTTGKAITATTLGGEFVCAMALESAVADGDKIRCCWLFGFAQETAGA